MEVLSPPKHTRASDRTFGWVMGTFLLLVAAAPLLWGKPVRPWLLAVSAGFFVLALLVPAALGPVNKAWMKFGELMGKVVSPLALAVLFFLVITPYGRLMRVFGKGTIPVRFDAGKESYWIARDPPGPDPRSLKDPF